MIPVTCFNSFAFAGSGSARRNHGFNASRQTAIIHRSGHAAGADEVAERLLEAVKRTGAGVVHLRMNTGALPHDMFMNQIKLFADKVLPRLQAYESKEVPAAAEEHVPAK
jgi:hypothetical protein